MAAKRSASRNQHILSIIALHALLIFFMNVHIGHSEPVVSLKFYDNLFLRVNVKKYILVYKPVGTIACDVEKIPPAVQGNITLILGTEVLKESSVQDRPLIWRGNIRSDLPEKFTCEVKFADDYFTSRITLSEVMVSGNYSSGTCFPRRGDVFLEGELIPTTCIANSFTSWILDDSTKQLLTPVVLRPSSRYRIQATNYIQFSNRSSLIQCVLPGKNDRPIEHICNVSAQEINLEDKLTIDINPKNFSVASELESLTFICRTNLPTELISWRAKSEVGDVLDLDFDGILRLNFSITHLHQSSELRFPDGVSGIKTVSCWTSRAGQSSGALSFNITQAKEDESCKDEIPTGSPSLTHPFPVESSTIVIAFGILTILCVALLIVVACLLKRQCKKGSGEISVGYMKAVHKYSRTDDEPYYSTSVEGHIVTHESLEQDQQYINVKDSSFSYPEKRSSTYEVCS